MTTTADLLTPADAAALIAEREQRSMSARRVQRLCRQGRMPGAVKKARDWLIPRDSVDAWQPRPSGNPGHFG